MPSVLKIEEITETVEVFDITVEVDESFIVADAVLHNCPACGGLDRTRYKTGEPHPALPVHQNCRCVLLPVTILSDLVEESRPMARSDFMADAKRRYEAKYPGKKWEELSESTRKKYYYKEMREYERTTGQSAYTQVSGGMSFKEYFQNEMTDQQRQDWLGKKRYRIWKHGNLPIDNYIPPYPNKEMTVEKLKELDKASFAQKSPAKIIKRTEKLSSDEVDAIEQYTKSDDYAEMNDYLRTGETGNDYFDRQTQLLNSAISKSEVSEDITVWRGVSRADLRITNEEVSELSIKSFTSTSLSRSVADKFSGDNHKDAVIYKITVLKGSHAIDAMGISMKPEEREILLPPGGKFTVQRVYYEKEKDGSNGRQIVEVTYGA